MMDGRIVKEGGPELAHELEAKGYESSRAPQLPQASDSTGNRSRQLQSPKERPMVATPKPQVDIGEYQYGFRDEEDYFLQERARARPRNGRSRSRR